MKTKYRVLTASALLMCSGLLFWTLSENDSFKTGFVQAEPIAQEVSNPVFLKTAHGTFDLTAPPITIKGVPKEYRDLKSLTDSNGCVRHMLQFKGKISHAEREAIIAVGGTLDGYMPENVMIVSAPRELASGLSEIKGVATVSERPPWVSLDPYLMESLEGKADAAIVKLSIGGRNFTDVTPILGKYGIEYKTGHNPALITGVLSDLKTRVIPLLLMHPEISYVGRHSPIRVMSPPDAGTTPVADVSSAPIIPMNDVASGLIQDGGTGTPLWLAGLTGAGQNMLMVDSGLDYDHLYFYGGGAITATVPISGPSTMPVAADSGQRKVIAYYDWNLDAYDYDKGHGTHVCGSMCGEFEGAAFNVNVYNTDGESFLWQQSSANLDGMAPKAKVVISDVSVSSGGLMVPGLDYTFGPAVVHDAFLINNSWGGVLDSDGDLIRDIPPINYDAEASTGDYWMYQNDQILALWAAGNDGDLTDDTWNAPMLTSYGQCKNNLLVGATGDAYGGSTTGFDRRAYFSSYGPTDDGRIRPHVMAPGYFVASAFGDGSISGPSSDMILGVGTSMATPVACGGMALVRQYFTDGFYPGSSSYPNGYITPSAALLKAVAIISCTDMYAADTVNVDHEIPSNYQGWGRLVLDDALELSGDTRNLYVVNRGGPVVTDAVSIQEVYVNSSLDPLRVTLVWTDPPAAPNAGIAIVNDLDLEVIGPNGTYLGNNFVSGVSVTGGSADSINTEECVYLNNPPVGLYTIRVIGANVPGIALIDSERQTFALAVTGRITDPSTRKALRYSGFTLKESTRNDGTIDGAITVSITGETFSANVLDYLTFANGTVPSGLTPTVRHDSDTQLTIWLTDAADYHTDDDDVYDFQISFGPLAFTGGSVNAIANQPQAFMIDFIDFIPSSGGGSGGGCAIGTAMSLGGLLPLMIVMLGVGLVRRRRTR